MHCYEPVLFRLNKFSFVFIHIRYDPSYDISRPKGSDMSTAEALEYRYTFASLLKQSPQNDELFLADYSEVAPVSPHFFSGRLSNPYITARALMTLADVVKSNFQLTREQIEAMRDPVVTIGNGHIRFEGFSQCAGVYARVDVNEEEQKEAFLSAGTTNVDFNPEMIAALGRVGKSTPFTLNVGKKSVAVKTDKADVTEKKVPLPRKWIKGMTSVQHYLSRSEPVCTLNRLQAIQLFRAIPKGAVKTDYHLIQRAGRYTFSPMAQPGAPVVGGLNRLSLLQPLLPLINELKVFAHADNQSVTWQFYFEHVTFSLTLSRDPWRGFSGEGTMLEELMSEIPEEVIEKLNNFGYANQAFSPTMLSVRIGKDEQETKALTAKLAAMGLLGYDLDRRQFFYRRLPFKPERIHSLNPRLKGAHKLVDEGKVRITDNKNGRIEARVEGSGVEHLVVIKDGTAKCTCQWYSKHQGERGDCKHVLAVKSVVKS